MVIRITCVIIVMSCSMMIQPSLDKTEVAIVSHQRALRSEDIVPEEAAAIPDARPEAGHSPGDD